jgi:hypothetical protein
MGGWEAAWVGLGGSRNSFPSHMIKFIVDTVNKNKLEIIGVQLIFGSNTKSLGFVDLTNATLVASTVEDGILVNIWKVPSRGSIYDDPGVQAVIRQYSYPGSNPLEEDYAIYLYIHGLPDDSFNDLITWIQGRMGVSLAQPFSP